MEGIEKKDYKKGAKSGVRCREQKTSLRMRMKTVNRDVGKMD